MLTTSRYNQNKQSMKDMINKKNKEENCEISDNEVCYDNKENVLSNNTILKKSDLKSRSPIDVSFE
jgi:hypothetical protein